MGGDLGPVDLKTQDFHTYSATLLDILDLTPATATATPEL